jgi:hypothetical protein
MPAKLGSTDDTDKPPITSKGTRFKLMELISSISNPTKCDPCDKLGVSHTILFELKYEADTTGPSSNIQDTLRSEANDSPIKVIKTPGAPMETIDGDA